MSDSPSSLEKEKEKKTKTVYDYMPCLRHCRKKHISLWKFFAKNQDEISLDEGELVYIVKEEKKKVGSWSWSEVERCRKSSEYGLVPRSFLVENETYLTNQFYDSDWYIGEMDPLEASKLLLEKERPRGAFLVCAPKNYMDKNLMWEEYALLIRIRKRPKDLLKNDWRRRVSSRRSGKDIPTPDLLGKDQIGKMFGENRDAMLHVSRIRRDKSGRYAVNPGEWASSLYTLLSLLKESPGYVPCKPRRGIVRQNRVQPVPYPPVHAFSTKRSHLASIHSLDTEQDLNPHGIKRENIKFLEMLGEGNFATVKLATLVEKSMKETRVAVKIPKSKAKTDEFREEAIQMSKIDHKNVSKFLGFLEDEEPSWMILEYMDGGCLTDYLKNHRLLPRQKVEFMYEIARAMCELEEKRVVHRDLAARNILIKKNKSDVTVKISDFGLACSIPKSQVDVVIKTQDTDGGTELPWRWMAPEAIRQKRFSSKSDVWSFGVLICEILDNAESIPYCLSEDLVDDLLHENSLPYDALDPPRIYAIAAKCWNFDPGKRPAFNELASEFYSLLFDSVVQFDPGSFLEDAVTAKPDYVSAATTPSQEYYATSSEEISYKF